MPEDHSPVALVSFQQKVKLLRMPESRCYLAEISGLNLRLTENGSSIDRVRRSGGLTGKGRVVLKHFM